MVPDEPGEGLEHVRMMPPEKRDPLPGGAGASPGALHDSGPTPASIARGSRDSITVHSVEVRGGVLVFRRLTGLLLGRPLRRGHVASLGIHRRKGFHFRHGIGLGWDFEGRRKCSNQRGNSGGRALRRLMRERRRGLCRLQAMTPADQSLGEFPIARRPARPHPPEAHTIATIPAQTASLRRCQGARVTSPLDPAPKRP